MNIYKVTREDDVDCTDQYIEMVVYAETEQSAKLIHPTGNSNLKWNGRKQHWSMVYSGWPHLKYLKVHYLGIATEDVKEGIISTSFKAG